MAKSKKKKPVVQIRLHVPAGKASPAPPIGPALSQHGVNIMAFVNEFNKQTAAMGDAIIPVVINVYEDKSFDFVLKKPPVSYYLRKAAGVEKGASEPGRQIVARLRRSQIAEIAREKMQDMRVNDLEAAMRVIEGTAKSMGIEIVED